MLRLSTTGLILLSALALPGLAIAQSPSPDAGAPSALTGPFEPFSLVSPFDLSVRIDPMAMPPPVELTELPGRLDAIIPLALVVLAAPPTLVDLMALPGLVGEIEAPAVVMVAAPLALTAVTGRVDGIVPIALVDLVAPAALVDSRALPATGTALGGGIGVLRLHPRETFRSALSGRQPYNRLVWSYVGLQSLDFMSTVKALHLGASESNPVMKIVVGQPLVFAAVKSATAWAIVRVLGGLRERHPRAATFVLGAIDGAYALIVIHNYQTAARYN